jgi:hypothetical protein
MLETILLIAFTIFSLLIVKYLNYYNSSNGIRGKLFVIELEKEANSNPKEDGIRFKNISMM